MLLLLLLFTLCRLPASNIIIEDRFDYLSLILEIYRSIPVSILLVTISAAVRVQTYTNRWHLFATVNTQLPLSLYWVVLFVTSKPTRPMFCYVAFQDHVDQPVAVAPLSLLLHLYRKRTFWGYTDRIPVLSPSQPCKSAEINAKH